PIVRTSHKMCGSMTRQPPDSLRAVPSRGLGSRARPCMSSWTRRSSLPSRSAPRCRWCREAPLPLPARLRLCPGDPRLGTVSAGGRAGRARHPLPRESRPPRCPARSPRAEAARGDSNPDVLIALARACFIWGDVRATTSEQKLDAYDRGRRVATRAIARVPRSAAEARRELQAVLGERAPTNRADWTLKDSREAQALSRVHRDEILSAFAPEVSQTLCPR